MDNVIFAIIGGLSISICCLYIWSKLYSEHIFIKNFKVILYLLLMSVLMAFNYFFVNGFIRILLIALICAVFNFLIFKKSIKETIASTILSELIMLISEIILSLFAFSILMIDKNVAINKYVGTLASNLIIVVISLFICQIKKFQSLYIKLKKSTSIISSKYLIIVFSFIMIIVNFLLVIPYYQIDIQYIILFNIGLIAIYSFIVFKMLEQKNNYIKVNNKYNMTKVTMNELSQNITRLKMSNHENKNTLKTIRRKLKKEDVDGSIKYIDKIVEKVEKEDEQVSFQTSLILNSTISSIIYSKILTIKELKIEYNLLVDRSINDLNIVDMDEELNIETCKIIGVYLDNAIEAVKDLKNKLINIELYKEDKLFCISISNNFEGNIELDKLDAPGYTTKKEGHGYGLSLVKEIANSNKKLDIETEISDNIFKQIIKIKQM